MKSERASRFSCVAWFGAGLFLLGAMATYREDVTRLGDSSWHNVCGTIGFWMARLLLTHLGYAAFLIPLALLGEGSRIFRGASGRPLWVRTVGILLFAATLAAVLADLFSGRSAWIPDPGGDFGVALAMLLKNDRGLGLIGGRITLAVMFLLTFILYADLLYAGSTESALRWIDDRGGLLAVLPFTGRRASTSKKLVKKRRSRDGEEDGSSKAELDRALDDALGVERDDAEEAERDEDDEDDEDDEEAAPPPKRRRTKRAAKADAEEEEEEEEDEEAPDEDDEEPPPKRIPLIVMPRKPQPAIVAKEIQAPEPPQVRSNRPYRFPPFNLLDAQRRESSGDFLRFTDEVFVNTANTIVVPAYHLIDALASYTVNRHLTIRMNLNNLTDEVYIRNINNNGGRYNPGFRRSVLINTQVGF